MLHVKLKVVGGELETKELSLRLPAVIGRGHDAGIHLAHPLVSRRHCEIWESDGRLWVRDLRSLNGTFVGSERVQEAELGPGELLTVGTVTFRAIYELASDSVLCADSTVTTVGSNASAGEQECNNAALTRAGAGLSDEGLSEAAFGAEADTKRVNTVEAKSGRSESGIAETLPDDSKAIDPRGRPEGSPVEIPG